MKREDNLAFWEVTRITMTYTTSPSSRSIRSRSQSSRYAHALNLRSSEF